MIVLNILGCRNEQNSYAALISQLSFRWINDNLFGEHVLHYMYI